MARQDFGRRQLQSGGSSAEELPVHALTTAEALLVWGIRHWVGCLKARTDPIPLMTAGFGSGGVGGAVRPLEAILMLTLDTATSPRDVRCTHCATVGDGERDLLAAVAFEQAGRAADTIGKLREWLPPAASRVAKDLVAEIARAFHNCELIVPPRREYGSRRVGGHYPDIRAAVPASLAVH
ncbi:hypothetical protein [Thalassobaculum sp.]|uniref:hypothetical protein n=1 Tax=Thalassobaculum sp. TaxID=2022740 RepID=UPI0032EE2BAF